MYAMFRVRTLARRPFIEVRIWLTALTSPRRAGNPHFDSTRQVVALL
jgi:hypothetical protein